MNFKEAQLITHLHALNELHESAAIDRKSIIKHLKEMVSNLEIQTNIQRNMIEELNIESNRFKKISVEQQDLIEKQQILISKIGVNYDVTKTTN